MMKNSVTDYVQMLRELKVRSTKETGPDSRVLIVDGLNSYIRVFSAVPVTNEDGEHIGGVAGFLRSIAFVTRMIKPTRVVIVFDGKGGSVRRKDLYSEYKAGRTVNTKFNRLDHVEIDVDQEVKNMKKQLSRLVDYLECLPITLISIDNIEADDAIAYLTTDVYHNSDQVTIMSDDKDFLQLVNDKVNVWRPVEKQLYNATKVHEKVGLPAHNYLIAKLFTGDSSDNIKGIKGVGVKTLVKHIPELLSDTKITLDDIIRIASDRTALHSAKIYQDILLHENVLRLNYNLMQLESVDISASIKSNIRNLVLDTDIPIIERFKFKKLLMEDRAYNVFKFPDKWLTESFNNLASYANVRNNR
jgi:5'-3' exonuclease